MNAPNLTDYKDLKLKLEGIVPAGQELFRNMLFDAMYASLPRDPEARVQVYNAEIIPVALPTTTATTARRSSSRSRASSRHTSRKGC
jgi:hypothetical protein